MHIVLHEPEIPGNTGNIGRSCAATNTSLHLIEPLGFEITEKELRRAGLDYWAQLDVHRYRDYEDFMLENFGGSDPQTEVRTEKQAEEKTGCKENSSFLQTGSAAAVSRPPRLWYATTKARQAYTDVRYGPDDYIMLGNESRGIPEEILVEHPDTCVRIPMWGEIRSLNLANSAAIILYEALRQNGFPELSGQGELHRLHW